MTYLERPDHQLAAKQALLYFEHLHRQIPVEAHPHVLCAVLLSQKRFSRRLFFP